MKIFGFDLHEWAWGAVVAVALYALIILAGCLTQYLYGV